MNIWQKIKSIFKNEADSAPVVTEQPSNQANQAPKITVSQLQNSLFSLDSISGEKAMRQETVYACVQLISSSVAQLPLFLYKKTSKGREIAKDHPLYSVLHDSPNVYNTPLSFIEFLTTNMLLYGIAAAYVVRVAGKVKRLIPLPYDCFDEDWDIYGNPTYYANLNGSFKKVSAKDLLICKGMSLDGKIGLSPIKYAASLISTNLAAENYNQKFYENGAKPSGILQTPDALEPETVQTIKSEWHTNYGGRNIGKIAVLSGGMDYKPISMSNSDAQLLEMLGYNRNQICALFGVPPYMVGGVETSSSWGTGIEQQRLNMLTFTLTPWLKRIQQAMMRDLLTTAERESFYIEFLTEGFLNTDTKSRYEAYKIALGGTQAPGFLSQNEVRARENLPPIEGSDFLYAPVPAVKDINSEVSDEETNRNA